MNIAGDLIALEKQFWKGDADFYRQRLTAEALIVFPDAVGVLGKEDGHAKRRQPFRSLWASGRDKALQTPIDEAHLN
jgi:hypothetical protein